MCLSRRVEREIGEEYLSIGLILSFDFLMLKVSYFIICYFRCGEIFQKCLRSVKKAGVIPFVVFDGLSLPAKAGENARRRR